MSNAQQLARRQFLLGAGGMISSLSLGCGGGGGGGGGSEEPNEDRSAYYQPTELDFEQRSGPVLPTVVKPGVVTLPVDGSLTLVEQSASRLLLTGPGAAGLTLTPGTLFFTELNGGLVRRILSVASDGGTGRVLEVEPVDLDEVFVQLDLRFYGYAGEEGSGRALSPVPGAKFPSIQRKIGPFGQEGVRVEGSGKLTNILLGADILIRDGALERYKFLGNISLVGEVTLATSAKASIGRTFLLSDIKPLQPLKAVSSLVVLRPEFDLGILIKGDFEAGESFRYSNTLGLSGSLEYDAQTTPIPKVVRYPFKPGKPQWTRNPKNNPAIGMQVTAGLVTKLGFRVLGTVSPYLKAVAPYVRVDAQADDLWIGMGVKAYVGGCSYFGATVGGLKFWRLAPSDTEDDPVCEPEEDELVHLPIAKLETKIHDKYYPFNVTSTGTIR